MYHGYRRSTSLIRNLISGATGNALLAMMAIRDATEDQLRQKQVEVVKLPLTQSEEIAEWNRQVAAKNAQRKMK